MDEAKIAEMERELAELEGEEGEEAEEEEEEEEDGDDDGEDEGSEVGLRNRLRLVDEVSLQYYSVPVPVMYTMSLYCTSTLYTCSYGVDQSEPVAELVAGSPRVREVRTPRPRLRRATAEGRGTAPAPGEVKRRGG